MNELTSQAAVDIALIGAVTTTIGTLANFILAIVNHASAKEDGKVSREAIEAKVDKVSLTTKDTNEQVSQVASVVDGRVQQLLALTEKVTRNRGNDQEQPLRWDDNLFDNSQRMEKHVRGQRRDDSPDDTRTFRRSWSQRMESEDPDDYK